MRSFAILGLLLALASPVRAEQPMGGEVLYQASCAMCHRADGAGVPGVYPRLAARAAQMAEAAGGLEYLIQVIVFGLAGPIDVDGVPVEGVMPGFPGLTDVQVGALVAYLRGSFDGKPVSPRSAPPESLVQAVREKRLSPNQVREARRALSSHGLPAAGATQTSSASNVGAVRAVASVATPVTPRKLRGAALDYALHCQGCHRSDGKTEPSSVPPLHGYVGYFTHAAEGREYLVRVPGVAQAPIDDARLAALLNWMLLAFSAEQVARDFEPYTASEVGRLRAMPLVAINRRRAEIMRVLKASNVLP